jgi:hypothetical protein
MIVTKKMADILFAILETNPNWIPWGNNGAYEIPVNNPRRGNPCVQLRWHGNNNEAIWGDVEIYGCGCCIPSRKLIEDRQEWDDFLIFLTYPPYEKEGN